MQYTLDEFQTLTESLDNAYPFALSMSTFPSYVVSQFEFEAAGKTYAVRFIRIPKFPRSCNITVGRVLGKKVSPKLDNVGNFKKFIATVIGIIQHYGIEMNAKRSVGLRMSFDSGDWDKMGKLIHRLAKFALRAKYNIAVAIGPDLNREYLYCVRKGAEMYQLFPIVDGDAGAVAGTSMTASNEPASADEVGQPEDPLTQKPKTSIKLSGVGDTNPVIDLDKVPVSSGSEPDWEDFAVEPPAPVGPPQYELPNKSAVRKLSMDDFGNLEITSNSRKALERSFEGKINIKAGMFELSSGMQINEIMGTLEQVKEEAGKDSVLYDKIVRELEKNQSQVLMAYDALAGQNEQMLSGSKGVNSIRKYTGNSYGDVNKYLRGAKASDLPNAEKITSDLDGLFSRKAVSLPKMINVYRGQGLHQSEIDALQNGEPYFFRGFTSTSMSLQVAIAFMRTYKGHPNNPTLKGQLTGSKHSADKLSVLMSIRGLSRIPCIIPGDLSSHSTELEIILPRDVQVSMVRNTAVTSLGEGAVAISMRVDGVHDRRTEEVAALEKLWTPSFGAYLMEAKQQPDEEHKSALIMAGLMDIVGYEAVLGKELLAKLDDEEHPWNVDLYTDDE